MPAERGKGEGVRIAIDARLELGLVGRRWRWGLGMCYSLDVQHNVVEGQPIPPVVCENVALW